MQRGAAAIVLLAIAACSSFGPLPPFDPAFLQMEESRGDLVTLGWLRRGPSGGRAPLLVVIEGDGAAWGRGKTAPRDPTPRSGAGAKLASGLAQGRSVLYLARPGQYLSAEQAARCSVRHWTDRRFADGPVAALAALVDRAQLPGQPVVLIGFSGGGVLAAEIALGRPDVLALITLAAPLDLAAWTGLHGLSPLASASPAGNLPALLVAAPFRQRHLYGARDRIVPPVLAAALAREMPAGTVRLLDGLAHDDDWAAPLATELQTLGID
jgi:pimeloyl-ACP methyl ester carboxylesterase